MPQPVNLDEEVEDDDYYFCIFAGESLTNADAPHVHVLLERGAYEGIYAGDPSAWAIMLFIISQEIAA